MQNHAIIHKCHCQERRALSAPPPMSNRVKLGNQKMKNGDEGDDEGGDEGGEKGGDECGDEGCNEGGAEDVGEVVDEGGDEGEV